MDFLLKVFPNLHSKLNLHREAKFQAEIQKPIVR